MQKKHIYVSRPVDEKGFIAWDQTENNTWETLINRQSEIIKNRACDEYVEGLNKINFSVKKAPQLYDVNKTLSQTTGWAVEPVAALIPPKEFFTLLSNKKFPAATFIRTPEELDYLQEPDIFHELYGHTPLLTMKTYADFVQEYGKLSLEATPKDRYKLFRLFWFTIEFGLINTKNGIRAYGGGILSSIGETQYCLTEKSIKKPFDPLSALRTPYRIDIMQPMYYVLNSFDDLYKVMEKGLLNLLEESKKLEDFAPLYPPKIKEENIDDEIKDEGPMSC